MALVWPGRLGSDQGKTESGGTHSAYPQWGFRGLLSLCEGQVTAGPCAGTAHRNRATRLSPSGTCSIVPGFATVWLSGGEKTRPKCPEPGASLWKTLPGCEMCKIPSGGFRSHQCAVRMEIPRILIFSNAALTLINALDSSVDENRLKEIYQKSCLFRVLIFKRYCTQQVCLCKEACYNDSQLLIISISLAGGRTTLSSRSLLYDVIISCKQE